MKAMKKNEMKSIRGGETVYTCKCGYQTTKPSNCVGHMIAKHPGAIATRWFKYFNIARKIFM